ncbi:uncharacterized protein LOC133871438 [Alnus glutinosa]|uniref:uncharacterized protein LOC133871438 n=1 Tax=Alnus glutinosa TaxID=3517 RepID=UPI002D79B7CD|nr:uncharacterized protein LOC133871438 [Alnus glutinosa]
MGMDPDTRVSFLIDQQVGGWNYVLVQNLFVEREAEQILSIALSPLCRPDRITWGGTKNGTFTVRSAYHLEMQRRRQEEGECSTQGDNTEFWKWLWGLQAPGVIKNFAWKVANELLPTRQNLFRRKVISAPFCPFCESETETTFHILWNCPSTTAVWQEAPGQLVIQAREMLVAFASENSRNTEEGVSNPHSLHLWEKPPPGWMKANWDAAVDQKLNRMSTGVVVRDEQGVVVAASMAIVPFIRDPSLAEAIGAWHALSLCSFQGFSQVNFERDSQVVVSVLQKGNQSCSSIGQIIEDTRHCLSALYPSRVTFVKHEANTAAHKLVKSALCRQIDHVWIKECPPVIQCVVANEQLS